MAICFLAIIAVAAFTEYARATGLHHDLTMTFISLAGIVGMILMLLRAVAKHTHALYNAERLD